MGTWPDDKDFYLKMRDDMLQTKHRRFQYNLIKVTSLGSLMGIGVLLAKDIRLTIFFYVIPFISFAFDLMIFAESFSLIRMSSFVYLEKKDRKDAEFRWEVFVRNNPDKLASIGNYLFTVIASISSFIILVFKSESPFLWFKNVFNVIWLVVLVSSLVLFKVIASKTGKREWITAVDVKNTKESTA